MSRFLHLLLLLPLLALLPSCSETDGPSEPESYGTPIRLSIALAAANGTSNAWTYKAGEANENIQNAFCVMIDATTLKVEHILHSATADEGKDQTSVSLAADGNQYIPTTTGPKIFYTFANITQAEVEEAIERAFGRATFQFAKGEEVDTALVNQAILAVKADGFTPSATQGIPMSGHQNVTFTTADNGQVRALTVVRMMGKLQFDFTNATAEPLTVQSITFDALTDNPSDGATNLFLMPSVTPSTGDGANIRVMPRLSSDGLSHHSPHTYAIGATLQAKEKLTRTFYVNETAQPNNAYGRFFITVTLSSTDATAGTTTTEQRYTLLSDSQDDWSFIARNDWRRIPITFQDYRLDLIPQDFPPIGVLPCSVVSTDTSFVCIFHTHGDFHLIPRLTNRTTGQTTDSFTATNVSWTNVSVPDGLFDFTPMWYPARSYVHGTFRLNAMGCSTHILTLTAMPDGVTARTFTTPVVIRRED